MRKFSWAVLSCLVFVLAVVLSGTSMAAELKPALVVLAQDQTPSEDERSVIDRLTTILVRNATHGRYGSTVFLTDDLANEFTLMRTISQLVRSGRTVDVFVFAAGDGDRIHLTEGDLTANRLVSTLKPIRGLSKGGLRFVYFTGGKAMAEAWQEIGAKAVLAQPSLGETVGVAPFFLPQFVTKWAEGMSVTQAAKHATEFSSRVMGVFSTFIDERIMAENEGVISPAPVFLGTDVNIYGRQTRALKLSAVTWPEELPARETFAHTGLRSGLLESLGRLFTNRYQVNAELVPGISELISSLGEPAWQTLYTIFPGRNRNELTVPGGDVRVILSRVIPGIDKYMGMLIDNLETMVVTRRDGKLSTDVWFVPAGGLSFDIREEKGSKTGQPYAVKLKQHVHLDISARRDSITIDGIRGITTYIKLPIVPDGVAPSKLYLDTSTETLTISAKAISGTVSVIAKADVRSREFKGVDWFATMFKNLPLILSLLFFGVL